MSEFVKLTPEDMEECADNVEGAQATLWHVCAQICERLDAIYALLESGVPVEYNVLGTDGDGE